MSVRKDIARQLRERPMTLHALSEALGLPTKVVMDHLDHLARSLRHEGASLHVHPARCRHCGFRFTQKRYTRPGRCPRCHSTWIAAPRLEVVEAR